MPDNTSSTTTQDTLPLYNVTDLRYNARYGIDIGVQELAKYAIVLGGIAVSTCAVYGAVTGGKFLTNKSRQIARNFWQRRAAYKALVRDTVVEEAPVQEATPSPAA